MVAYLSKSDASEGFNTIIDFLNGSSIKYALTVNPNIYVSCIKQFWTTVAIKKVNDVPTLQALVEKKKVVVTEATIREALRLDDVEGVECLPNEEIFAELARMGYENPSTKLTFYKAFFLSQWNLVKNVDSPSKFYMYPYFLQLMIRKQVGDLSTHTTKYTSPALTQKVFINIRRVGKGFSEVETPLFEGMLVEQQVVEEGDADENDENVNVGDTAEGDVSATHREVPTIAEEPSIPSITPPTPPSQPSHDIPSTSQAQPTPPPSPRDETEPSKVQEVVDVVTTTKIITEVVTAASETITAASTIITAAEAQVPAVTLITAPTRVTAAPSRRRKGVVIRDLQEKSTISTIIPTETRSKDKGKGILVEEPKPLKKQQQIKQDEKYARELETKAQARKNMMVYLKNVVGFKMDYFKGMSYDDICPIFEAKFNINVAFLQKTREQIEEEDSRALKRLNETPVEKAAKRKKLDEEVPVVDYQIIELNYKPYYKIIRADDTHQLYVSFMSLLRNFDREGLEGLWSLVKERFSTTKPKNFSDDFLLVILGAMFEKPDIHAQIWKNQRSVHGLAKVKGWKLLESCGV
nr:hypothetical protein [Tanacetum cinerariifolium]